MLPIEDIYQESSFIGPGSWSYAGLDSDDLTTLSTLVGSYLHNWWEFLFLFFVLCFVFCGFVFLVRRALPPSRPACGARLFFDKHPPIPPGARTKKKTNVNSVPPNGVAPSGGAFTTSACIAIPATCNPGYTGTGGTDPTACSPCGCGSLGCDSDGNCLLPALNPAWKPGLYAQQYLDNQTSIFTGANYQFDFVPTLNTWNSNTKLGVSGKQTYFDNSTAVCYVPWSPSGWTCHDDCCSGESRCGMACFF